MGSPRDGTASSEAEAASAADQPPPAAAAALGSAGGGGQQSKVKFEDLLHMVGDNGKWQIVIFLFTW